MEALRPDDVAAQVVAWHNRHPLARRITPADVASIGYVAMPFVDLGTRGRGSSALSPAFDEDFAAPLAPARVGRWAALHAFERLRPPDDGPLREIVSRAKSHVSTTTRYLLTAAIESGDQRIRLLLDERRPRAAVLGQRLLDRRRLLAAVTAVFVPALIAVGVALAPSTGDFAAAPKQAQTPGAGASTAVAHAASSGVVAARRVTASPSVASAADGPGDAMGQRHSAPVAIAHAAASVPPAAPAGSAAVVAEAHMKPPSAPAPSPVRVADSGRAAISPPPHGSAPASSPAAKPDEPALALAHASAPAASEALRTLATDSAVAARDASASKAPPRAKAGPIPLPGFGSLISDEDKAQARRVRAELVASGALKPHAPAAGAEGAASGSAPRAAVEASTLHSTAPPIEGAARPAVSASQVAGSAPAYAISSHRLRTHAEAEQLMVAMAALLRRTGSGGVRTEILPQGEDWRVASWPFARSDEAERARAMLAARGMRVQVVAF